MPGYVVLYKFTEKGFSGVKSLPEQIKRARTESEQMGIHVVGVWVTMGEYDMVAIVDAPDDQTLATRLLMTGKAGNAKTHTMRAFSEDEFAAIVARLPQ